MGNPLKELLVTRNDAKQVKEMDATTGTLKQEQEIDPTSTAALETGKHLIYVFICIHIRYICTVLDGIFFISTYHINSFYLFYSSLCSFLCQLVLPVLDA